MTRFDAQAALAALVLASALAPRTAGAHEVGLSRGDYTIGQDAAVLGRIVFARKELIGLVAGLDADHDGQLTERELDDAKDAILGAVVGRVVVTSDGARCTGSLDGTALTEQDGVALTARFRCAARPRKLRVTFGLLDDLAFGHRHLARLVAGPAPMDAVLSQRSPSIEVDVAPSSRSGATPPGAAPATSGELASAPLRGARAALRPEGPGFLLGALATMSGARAALVALAAFLGAATLGFALGARGAFLPSPIAVAAALAASVAYAGVDAWDAWGPPRGDRRAWVVLPFGVVHGLALATAASAMGPDAPLVPFAAGGLLALAGLGLAVVPLALLLGRALRARPWGLRALGGALALAGMAGIAWLALTRA
jgi:hypothetical protein